MAVADADRMQERQLDEVGVTEVDAANIDAALQPDQSMRDDASLVGDGRECAGSRRRLADWRRLLYPI